MIKAEHEDKISLFKVAFDKIQDMMDEEYEKFAQGLVEDGMKEDFEEHLFDYIWNEKCKEESFGEFLERYGKC